MYRRCRCHHPLSGGRPGRRRATDLDDDAPARLRVRQARACLGGDLLGRAGTHLEHARPPRHGNGRLGVRSDGPRALVRRGLVSAFGARFARAGLAGARRRLLRSRRRRIRGLRRRRRHSRRLRSRCRCDRSLGPGRRRRARRQQGQRVDVALLVGGQADAEVDERLRRVDDAARSHRAHRRALCDRLAPLDADRPQVQERRRVTRGQPNGDRAPTCRHGAGERDDARCRSAHLGSGR